MRQVHEPEVLSHESTLSARQCTLRYAHARVRCSECNCKN